MTLNSHRFTVPSLFWAALWSAATATATAIAGLGRLLIRMTPLADLPGTVRGTGVDRFLVIIGGCGVSSTYVLVSRFGGYVVGDGEFPLRRRLVRDIRSTIGGDRGRSVVAGQI